MSNWLEPACAREAMATGSPEIDTVGVAAAVDVVAAASGCGDIRRGNAERRDVAGRSLGAGGGGLAG